MSTQPAGHDATSDEEPPLAGTVVVDLSHLLAGPYCTMLMAEQGAEVIKVEPPNGDIARRRLPARTNRAGATASAYYLAVNRGKRSVQLDLKSAAGREQLLRLIERADVLVENFRADVLDRILLPREELTTRFPRLVVASISAYGIRGVSDAVRNLPGLAIVGEAVSGVLSHTRRAGEEPAWMGAFAMGDFTAGLAAYSAIVSALLRRARSGRGGLVDISICDTMLSFNSVALAKRAISDAPRGAADTFRSAPYGVFPARDGFIVLGVNTDVFWVRLCEIMNRPDLAVNDRFATDGQRMANSDEVNQLVAQWSGGVTRDELLSALAAGGIPSGPVNTPDDILDSELYRGRGMLIPVEDGVGGHVVLPGNPLGRSFARPRVAPLGEDTAAVLAGSAWGVPEPTSVAHGPESGE